MHSSCRRDNEASRKVSKLFEVVKSALEAYASNSKSRIGFYGGQALTVQGHRKALLGSKKDEPLNQQRAHTSQSPVLLGRIRAIPQ